MSHTDLKAMALALALGAAACGGSSSPVAPERGTGTSSATAVIAGNVRGTTSSLLAATGSQPITGLTVTVVGTSMTSGVDGAGMFQFSGVAPGDVQLRFSGAGVDTTLTLSQVQAAQNISLLVTVSGTAVTLDAELRNSASGTELEGRVESLPPTTPPGSLVVGGRTVTTDGSTRIERGGTARPFSDLEIGMRVHVRGAMSGSSLAATLIQIQNTNTTVPVSVNGIIDSLSGTAADFRFNIGSRAIRGNDFTEFFGDGDRPDSFASLRDGVRVEVRGQQRDGYVYAERIHVNGPDDDDDGNQDSSASIHGTLTAIGGSAAAPTLTVGGTTVRTSAETVVRRRGDVQPLSALQIGQSLHVVGTRQPDGSIDARMIQIDDDATGGQFEIEGSMGGLKGTCPTISFGVNGFSVATTGGTTFENGSCGALRNGMRVHVTGTRNADGSVTATRVRQ